MTQKFVNIRMDEDLKNSMEETCRELGMNITTAFTIFVKKVSREKRIPFEVSIDPFYSDRNIEAIKNSVVEMETGKVIEKTFEELEELEDE